MTAQDLSGSAAAAEGGEGRGGEPGLVRRIGPALLPTTLHDKPAEGLVATIYYGRPGTPMPPWKQFMSEAEAGWIVQKLLSGFPD